MPKFKYAAVAEGGQQVSGVLEADHPNDARLRLAERGVYVREIKEKASFMKMELTPKRVSRPFTWRSAWLKSGTAKEKAMGSPWCSAITARSGTSICFRSFASFWNSPPVMGRKPHVLSQAAS